MTWMLMWILAGQPYPWVIGMTSSQESCRTLGHQWTELNGGAYICGRVHQDMIVIDRTVWEGDQYE